MILSINLFENSIFFLYIFIWSQFLRCNKVWRIFREKKKIELIQNKYSANEVVYHTTKSQEDARHTNW